jgi:hypothetical protein
MVMRRVVGLFVAVLLVAGVVSAPSARAATFISVVATGTVTDSNDPGLLGAAISIEQRFTVNPALLFPGADTSVALFQTVQISVTLGAATEGYASTGAAQDFGIYTISKLDVPGSVPAAVDAQSGVEIFGGAMLLLANAKISSDSDDFVTSTDLLQNFVFPPFPAGATVSFGFSIEDTDGNVMVSATSTDVTSLTVTVREVAIPAPAALGLFAFGLVGLVAARRQFSAR